MILVDGRTKAKSALAEITHGGIAKPQRLYHSKVGPGIDSVRGVKLFDAA